MPLEYSVKCVWGTAKGLFSVALRVPTKVHAARGFSEYEPRMKDDGRLKSLGILLAMVAVIVAFFLMFQRKPAPIVIRPVAVSTASSHHHEAPLPPVPALPAPGVSSSGTATSSK